MRIDRMTEKRFILDDDGIVVDMVDLSMCIDNEDCCEKLNEVAEENKELKKELGSFKPIIFETENGTTTLYEKRGFESSSIPMWVMFE